MRSVVIRVYANIDQAQDAQSILARQGISASVDSQAGGPFTLQPLPGEAPTEPSIRLKVGQKYAVQARHILRRDQPRDDDAQALLDPAFESDLPHCPRCHTRHVHTYHPYLFAPLFVLFALPFMGYFSMDFRIIIGLIVLGLLLLLPAWFVVRWHCYDCGWRWRASDVNGTDAAL